MPWHINFRFCRLGYSLHRTKYIVSDSSPEKYAHKTLDWIFCFFLLVFVWLSNGSNWYQFQINILENRFDRYKLCAPLNISIYIVLCLTSNCIKLEIRFCLSILLCRCPGQQFTHSVHFSCFTCTWCRCCYCILYQFHFYDFRIWFLLCECKTFDAHKTSFIRMSHDRPGLESKESS